MRRGSSVSDLQKKRDKNAQKVKNLGGDKKYVQNRNNTQGGGGKTGGVSTTTKQGKKRTPAQMAAANRLAQKKAGTYKKPMTPKELAKKRLKIKK